jgi:Uma2 family endonuclease
MSALVEDAPLVVRFTPATQLDDERLYEFCQVNRDLRIEREPNGTLTIMPPAGGHSSQRNLAIAAQLYAWSKRDSTGIATDSSGGHILPNSALRAPDAAWVRRERIGARPAEEWERFPHVCPDFVIELRSPADRLADMQAKMDEYLGNGAQLGWLIDPINRTVRIYRPGRPVKLLREPMQLSGDPVLPGFVLDLTEVW